MEKIILLLLVALSMSSCIGSEHQAKYEIQQCEKKIRIVEYELKKINILLTKEEEEYIKAYEKFIADRETIEFAKKWGVRTPIKNFLITLDKRRVDNLTVPLSAEKRKYCEKRALLAKYQSEISVLTEWLERRKE